MHNLVFVRHVYIEFFHHTSGHEIFKCKKSKLSLSWNFYWSEKNMFPYN